LKFNKIIGFAIGPVAGAAFGLITVPMIAWAFSAEDVGRMNILQVTISFCILFFVLGLDQAYVREFHESKDHPQLLKACFAPGFLFLIIVGFTTMAYGSELSLLLFGSADPAFYWLTLASVIATFILGFLSLILRMQERGLAFSMSQLISKALLLLSIGSVLLFDLSRSFINLQLAFMASTMAVVLVFLWNTRLEWRPAITAQLDRRQVRSLLKFGTPLIFSGLAYWGLIATSSIALRSLSSFSELGIYSVTMSFAGVASIIQSVFSVVWAPIVYRWVAEKKDLSKIDNIARQALTIVCGIIVLCGISSWLIDYILPIRYEQVKYLVLCAMIQPLLYTLSEVTCIGISLTRRTILSVWVTLAALATNILFSLWLVPLEGATGAVIANAIAYLVFFIARTEASAYVWRQFPRLKIYIFASIAVGLSVGTASLGPTLSCHYSLAWLLISPLAIWFLRTEIAKLMKAGRIFMRSYKNL
jgi:O-antigen/teichoic acid export membrane protein